MPRMGSVRHGSSQHGVVGTVRTITLDASSSSTLSHDINGIFTVDLTSASTSALSNSINGIFTLSKSATSTSTLSHSINGTFTIELKTEKRRLGESRLGSERHGAISEFESKSSLSLEQQAVRNVELSAQSDSEASFNIARVLIVNLNSASVSSLEFILSEDSYAEQYGRSRGQAEIDTIVEGNAELDIIVVGNAEVD